MTCTEATTDHDNGMGIETAKDNLIQHTKDTVSDPAMTHHTGHTTNHPHTAAHQVTALRITVDHIQANIPDHQNITHTKEGHTV